MSDPPSIALEYLPYGDLKSFLKVNDDNVKWATGGLVKSHITPPCQYRLIASLFDFSKHFHVLCSLVIIHLNNKNSIM